LRCDVHAIAPGIGRPEAYAASAGEEAVERVRELATPLEGVRLLHLVSAAARARPPEPLPGLVALLRGAGLRAEWRLLGGDREWFELARQLEDGLRGGETALEPDALECFRRAVRASVARLLESSDVVVLHGAAALAAAPDAELPAIWAPDVAAGSPSEQAWHVLAPAAARCRAWVAATASLTPTAPEGVDLHTASPVLDPLSPAALDIPVATTGAFARSLGVDLSRPFACELWPFDPWADPFAALDAFEAARTEIGELQLVLAGAPVTGDQPGFALMREVEEIAGDTPGVLVAGPLGAAEAGAMLQLARVAVDSALRPGGPGPALAAMWKRTPVIALGDARRSHPLRDREDGYLAASAEEAAERLVELVRDPGLAAELGASAHARVRANHLLPALAAEELSLIGALTADDAASVQHP
jgi:trehalose synthase